MKRPSLYPAIFIGATSLAGTLTATIPAYAATVPNFSQDGFTHVVATANLAAGQGTILQMTGVTITIPAGAFKDPVQFQVLQSPLSQLTAKAPTGQSALYDFAFQVTDQNTHKLVGMFQKPVVFTYTAPAVNTHSIYYNITPQGKWVANPVPAQITGHTLKHAIIGAPVAWAVTSPATTVAATTSPITGLPFFTWAVTGLSLLAVGGVVLGLRRKMS